MKTSKDLYHVKMVLRLEINSNGKSASQVAADLDTLHYNLNHLSMPYYKDAPLVSALPVALPKLRRMGICYFVWRKAYDLLQRYRDIQAAKRHHKRQQRLQSIANS